MSKANSIVVSGAREHNLKDVSLTLPRDALTVITGLSGSGKSSLAFDTIYAEGQRRYVESLSAYARQFLGQMDKPDVDSIEGLSPAISIDQKTTSKNPRSTVGTVTEIYDYLRLLWSRIGHPHCYKCGAPIAGQSVEQIIDQVMELPEGSRFMVMAPIVRGRKGEYGKLLADLRADGYARAKVDGELRGLEEEIVLDKKFKHDISLVVDRLVMRGEVRKRLADSIETAIALADGIIEVEILPGRDAPAGTAGEVLTFSEKFACLNCGTSMPELEPRIFSFNSPHGACDRCTGLGSMMEIDPGLVVPDPSLSLDEGAITPWANSSSQYYDQIGEAISDAYGIDRTVPFQSLPQAEQDLYLFGLGDDRVPVTYKNRYGRTRSYNARFEGVMPNLERRYRETDSEQIRERIEEFMAVVPCPACKGSRLRPESRSVLVGGTAIHEFCSLSVRRAMTWLDEVQLTETERHIARLIVREIEERLRFLENVGIGYLSMDRAAATLSGGEAQRIRLATQIGSALVGVLYVLDEPSIGLHQRDNTKLIRTLERLRDLGNTVLVVEHDEQTMRAADHIVDMGPGAGEHGGHVVAEGTADEIALVKASLTGQHLAGTSVIPVPEKRRKPSGHLEIRGAKQHNLKGVDVRVPLGTLTCVTGVSGSGKSTLVNEVLYKAVANKLHRARQRAGAHTAVLGLDAVDKIIAIDQSPIGRTPRSNPATYTGLFDVIRDIYSKTQESRARGYKAGRFSFNVKGGRCEVCKGDGQIKIEMHFLPDVYVPCEQCHGKRYNKETLDIRFKGKSIADVLAMPVEEAVVFFENIPKIRRRLETLNDVGLGYIRLGQPATTLSGGEAQRVKLATELSKVATGRTLYILDEPTTGLHFADVQRLLVVLHRLVDQGNSVVVIEHNLDVIKTADRLVDMGPEGGEEGGTVVAQGTPEEVAAVAASYTGQFLRDLVVPAEVKASRRMPKPPARKAKAAA
ncbi:excinuclease ABC subunit UvrA [Paraconexibacter antarcticus]|uniref:UvrABC system protein A n=1 Tax=Paraconexibacter antarcticus TaxID=2949664 RepID=A0ABY5DL09_9ACTN|nr:excinuclease ABC subunit UvrA [Paraconexibacter antarcticus]UTI62465.1 excinuclease ABC subunit UvrA [Paraconexibacter antarcticus]